MAQCCCRLWRQRWHEWGRLFGTAFFTFLLSLALSVTAGAEEPIREEELEQLFQIAALWEVGTNRERVREARDKLVALGTEAVRFIIENHLDYTTTLERRAVEEVLRRLKDIAGPRIVDIIRSEKTETVRLRNAFDLCGSLQWADCVPILLDWLSRSTELSISGLRSLIGALGPLKATAAIPALGSFLDHADDRVVVTTAHTMKMIGDARAIPLLLKRLESGNLIRRSAAEDALVGFADAARKEVLTRLDYQNNPPRVLAHYLNIIARIGVRGEYRRIRKFLQHPEETVRGYAVRAAIVAGGEKALKDLRRLRERETSPFVLGEIDRALTGISP